LIAIDWGTSNFRAFRLDEAGEIIERRLFPSGVLRVEEGRFADATVTPDDQNATHSATCDLKKAPEFLTLQVAAHEHGPMVVGYPLGLPGGSRPGRRRPLISTAASSPRAFRRIVDKLVPATAVPQPS